MKEYLYPVGAIAETMEGHTSILSCGLGYKSAQFSKRDWEKLAKIVAQELFGRDPGPWKAGETHDGRVYIESDIFHNDARFYLDGNFTGLLDKLSYAASIARALNSPFVEDRAWGKEWQEFVSAPRDRPFLATCRGYYQDGRPDPMAVLQWSRRYSRYEYAETGTSSGISFTQWGPTHWMELPEAPRAPDQ